MEVHAEIAGEPGAPPLVLVSSLGTDLTMWDPQVPTLSATHRVIRFDLRGHGHSPSPRGPYTIDELGADLVALLDRLGIERTAVCGISLGGLTALWLAQRHPHRVERVVLANTAARIGTREGWQARADTVRRDGTSAVADVVIERFLSPGFRERAPATAGRLRRRLCELDDEGYAACCLALAQADLRERVETVTTPALVIAGTEDGATPVADAGWLDDHLPDSRLVVLPGAGHLSSIEQPKSFTAAVLGFLQEDAT